MRILGVWDGHDAGAALLIDGRLVAAVNEERLSRRKLEVHFPSRAIAACLDFARLSPDAVDVVAMSTTDVAKTISRVWPSTKESYYQVRRRKAERGALARFTHLAKYRITEWGPTAISAAISRRACLGDLRASGIVRATLRLYDHHACHAAAAAHASGFDSAVVITLDGVGDGRSASVSRFRNGRLEPIASTPASCSPGVFFEHVTHLLNMRVLEDEGKVMALSDWASPLPDHANPMLPLLTVRQLQFCTAGPVSQLVGPLRRILWRYPNEQFAFMAQRTLERTCAELATQAVAATGESRVALAGGIASNIKVNRRIRLLPGVEDVYVFPHMGDGGLALGAAVLARSDAGDPTVPLLPSMALGPEYDCATIERALTGHGLRYQRPPDIGDAVAELIAGERVVLWMQGRMEYGPRSLGQRSVLARPDRPALRDRLNLVLKRRVWYQPFCPSLLDSEAHRLLADFTGRPNRHMTMAYMVAPAHREALAGVISLDGSCRPQMVPDDEVGPFANLLRRLRARIGVGAVLNTSFNLHGSPLVCSPDEALSVFAHSGADAIAMGPYLALADGLARP
jgi:carbamoyltransferase